jgi:hypothetical protein
MSSRANRPARKQRAYTSRDNYTSHSLGSGSPSGGADQGGKSHGDGEGFRRSPKAKKSTSKGR